MCDDKELALVLIFLKKSISNHIHRGLTIENYADEILGAHVKPQIDYHALADRAVFTSMQDAATPHTVRMNKPRISYQSDIWCPSVASKDINTFESVISSYINGINSLPRRNVSCKASHIRWLVQRSTPTPRHRPSSMWIWQSLLNSCMFFF